MSDVVPTRRQPYEAPALQGASPTSRQPYEAPALRVARKAQPTGHVQLQPRHSEPLPNQEPHCIGHPDAAQEHAHLESGPTGSPIGPELGPVEHVKKG